MATLNVPRISQGRHEVVSPSEWLAARKKFLQKEKEFMRLRDELSRERRALPWQRVENDYVFEGPHGKETLADLFGSKSQLVVYHFMLGPGWKEGCPSCSFLADGFDGATIHLAHRDVSFVAISRATFPEIAAFQKRMGWQFKWVSSFASDFNRDYHVSFTPEEIKGKVYYNYDLIEFGVEEAPGMSVFYKNDAGEIFHTYSSYARGLDPMLPTYQWLDLTPKGRDEDGLRFSMAWVRHHDRYQEGEAVDPDRPYIPPEKMETSCCAEKDHMTTELNQMIDVLSIEARMPRTTEQMLSEFREEVAITRRVLDRVPGDKLSWRPHKKSMSLGQLAMHVASIPGRNARISQLDEFDVAQGNFNPPEAKNLEEIRTAFEEGVRGAEECMKSLSDQKAMGSWRLLNHGKQVFSRPRIEVMRSVMLNHWYHHRGQLSVYLRLLEIPVPVIYGRSADESPFA